MRGHRNGRRDTGRRRPRVSAADLFNNRRKRIRAKQDKLRNGNSLEVFKPIPDPENLGLISSYIKTRGVKMMSYKDRFLARRIKVRMRKLDLGTYMDYFSFLRLNSQELKNLEEALSINVTRFFRNKESFDELTDHQLPALMENASSRGRLNLNFWSAGCADGAEPYTLAIMMHEHRRKYPHSMRTKIRATDVSLEALAQARRAIYDKAYLDEIEPEDTKRWFQQTIGQEWQVRAQYRRTVRFDVHDLIKDKYPNGMDLITCRNVLIYMQREEQDVIFKKFHRALVPNGFLMLGRSESIMGKSRQLFDILSSKHRIYRRASLVGETGSTNQTR